MQQAIFWMVIAFGIFLIIDIYTFQAIKLAFGNHTWINVVYWLITLFVLGYMIYSTQSYDRASAPQKIINNFMGLMVLSYVPKLLIVVFLFSEDLFRVVQGSIVFLVDFFSQGSSGQEEASYIPGRRKFISQIGLALAAIPLGSILYGIYKGKYNFRVIRQTVFFEDLPDAFDGFTIAQISDIHSGSFTNKEKITYGVDLVNEQNADMIVFTGDLVNSESKEMRPWKSIFSKLKAPDGYLLELLQYHSHPEQKEIAKQRSNQLGCSHLAFSVNDINTVCEKIKEIEGSIVNPPALTNDKKVKERIHQLVDEFYCVPINKSIRVIIDVDPA